MRNTHISLLMVFAFLLMTPAINAQSNGYETFETNDFSIHYPAGWSVGDKKAGVLAYFLSPLESAKDEFSENINIMTQDLSEHPMTLKEYTDLSLKQIQTLATHGKLIESKTIQTANGEAQRLVYKADNGKFHLQFMQLYIVKKEKVYLITYTAETKNYKKYLPKVSDAMNSFVLKQ